MATEESELTFIRCPGCRSLVPAVATRCRMCGQLLDGKDGKEPVDDNSPEALAKKSRVRQRTMSVTQDDVDTIKEQFSQSPPEPVSPLNVEAGEPGDIGVVGDTWSDDSQSPFFDEASESSDEEELGDEGSEEGGDDDEDEEVSGASPQTQLPEDGKRKRKRRRRKKKRGDQEAGAQPNTQPPQGDRFEVRDRRPPEPVRAGHFRQSNQPRPEQERSESQPFEARGEMRREQHVEPRTDQHRTDRHRTEAKEEPRDEVRPEPVRHDHHDSKGTDQSRGDSGRYEAIRPEPFQDRSSARGQGEHRPDARSGPMRSDDSRRVAGFHVGGEHQIRSGQLIGWLVSFQESSQGAAQEIRSGRFFISAEKLRSTDFVISDPSVSTPQCLVIADPDHGFTIQDLMSEHGTSVRRVDGDTFTRQFEAVELHHGDWIRFGNYEVMVCLLPHKRR